MREKSNILLVLLGYNDYFATFGRF